MANKRVAIMITLTVVVALIYVAIPRNTRDTSTGTPGNPVNKTVSDGNESVSSTSQSVSDNSSTPGTVTAINGADFEKYVLQGKGAVLVDFWAPWCGPCRQMAPIVEEIAAANGGKLSVYKVNVDDNQPLASEYGISSIPTLIVFKDGQLVDKQVGLPSQDEVVQWVKNTAGI